VVGVSIKSIENNEKQNYTAKSDSTGMMERIFPWLQSNVASNADYTKDVKLFAEQTKNKTLVTQTADKDTNLWRHIVEKV